MKALRAPSIRSSAASSAGLLALVLLAGAGPIATDKPFAGDDAAYIDWAWKSCELLSTKKQHELADQARAKFGDAFMRGYEQQYNKILAAVATPPEKKRMCESIKDWYGPLGTRIPELIVTKDTRPVAPGTLVGPRSPPPAQGTPAPVGGKRGPF